MIATARKKYQRHYPLWAQAVGAEFEMALPITGTTRTDALVDQGAALDVLRKWFAYTGPGTVVTTRRNWAGFGTMDVPVKVKFGSPDDLAVFAGELIRWTLARERAQRIQVEWPEAIIPDGLFRRIVDLPGVDWGRLLDVLRWVDENDVEGFLARQLPIPGVDTKWVQRHWQLVEKLSAAGARSNPTVLGSLARIEKMTTVAILDPGLRSAAGGMRMFAAPPSELGALRLLPTTVIICENLQNIHAFPDMPGVVVLAGKGFDVPAHVSVPWVIASRILYWGDIDTHGFAILNRLRHYVSADSILMDRATLLAFETLWVEEDKPTAGDLSKLTTAENQIYGELVDGVHGHHVRFEQERVPWPAVAMALDSHGLKAAVRPNR